MSLRRDSLLSFGIILALFATGGVAHAANVFNITGPTPFGFANQTVLVQAWTHLATYSNVSITMPMEDNSAGGPIGGVEGTVYLMNRIGPGTTTASQVAPPVVISGLTASFTPRLLFSGLTLPPGNYYMVLVSTNSNPLSMSAEGSNPVVVTTGAGILALGSGSSGSPAVYPPASSIPLNPPGNLFITVTGDVVGVAPIPTLTEWGMIGMVALLAGLGLWAMRRRHPTALGA